MRVGIDARFALRAPLRGIGTYSLHLIKSLVSHSDSVEFVLYTDRNDYEQILPSKPNVSVKFLKPATYPFWEQFALPVAVKRDKLDILHSLGNTSSLLLFSSTKLVTTIHDVIYLQSGELHPGPRSIYQWAGSIYRALVVPTIARRSNFVITVSNFSRNDILKNIKQLDEKRVVAIHESCDPAFKQGVHHSSSQFIRPFLLCLGAVDPRKNTLGIIQAYLNATRKGKLSHDLIICGYKNWSGSLAHRLVLSEGASDRVIFLPFVAVDDLMTLYQQATALLYLSLYEGFGIPILEAFSCGCPVLASETTSIPEVGGDAAIYVDPTDILAIEDAIISLCNDTQLQAELRDYGIKRAQDFSWEKAAAQTLGIYHSVFQPRKKGTV